MLLILLFCIVLHVVCWTSEDHVHGLGGTAHKFGSVEECQQECLRTKYCVALDWDPTNSEGYTCWILTYLFVIPFTHDDVEFVHYVLNPACRSQSYFCFTWFATRQHHHHHYHHHVFAQSITVTMSNTAKRQYGGTLRQH